jgi:hypothetical protein
LRLPLLLTPDHRQHNKEIDMRAKDIKIGDILYCDPAAQWEIMSPRRDPKVAVVDPVLRHWRRGPNGGPYVAQNVSSFRSIQGILVVRTSLYHDQQSQGVVTLRSLRGPYEATDARVRATLDRQQQELAARQAATADRLALVDGAVRDAAERLGLQVRGNTTEVMLSPHQLTAMVDALAASGWRYTPPAS